MATDRGPVVRRLTAADLAAVRAIEERAYGQPWPPESLARELAENRLARYIVLEGDRGLQGFAGMWCVVDEAHIITVAVDPSLQGRGFGRALVHGLLLLAGEEAMEVATLEVRPSNAAARALYSAYGFVEAGRRERYYADGEDALILTTEPLESPRMLERLERLHAGLLRRLPGLRFELRAGPAEPVS